MEEDVSEWKHMPCPQTGRNYIVAMSVLPKATYRLHAIPFHMPTAFPPELEQRTLKGTRNHRRPCMATATLRKTEVSGMALPDAELHREAPASGDGAGGRAVGRGGDDVTSAGSAPLSVENSLLTILFGVPFCSENKSSSPRGKARREGSETVRTKLFCLLHFLTVAPERVTR